MSSPGRPASTGRKVDDTQAHYKNLRLVNLILSHQIEQLGAAQHTTARVMAQMLDRLDNSLAEIRADLGALRQELAALGRSTEAAALASDGWAVQTSEQLRRLTDEVRALPGRLATAQEIDALPPPLSLVEAVIELQEAPPADVAAVAAELGVELPPDLAELRTAAD